MTALLLKIVPWLAMIAGIVFGIFRHQQAKTTTAEAKQQIAEVRGEADQANTKAAQSGAAAVKERTDVENTIAAAPAGQSAQQLRDNWSRD